LSEARQPARKAHPKKRFKSKLFVTQAILNLSFAGEQLLAARFSLRCAAPARRKVLWENWNDVYVFSELARYHPQMVRR
jgi:hypothetical protein